MVTDRIGTYSEVGLEILRHFRAAQNSLQKAHITVAECHLQAAQAILSHLIHTHTVDRWLQLNKGE